MKVSVSFWISSWARRSSSSEISFFEQGFQVGVGIAADVANGNPGAFGPGTDDLGRIAATLLGQRRQRHAQGLAVAGRIQAQIGGQDGFSTAWIMERSKMEMERVRASSATTLANCFRGVAAP